MIELRDGKLFFLKGDFHGPQKQKKYPDNDPLFNRKKC